jgi:hypothetical protein
MRSWPQKRATTDPIARNGPNGIPILRAFEPCLAKSTRLGTIAASMPTIRAAETVRPRAAPMRSASFTSPIPIPAG